MQGSSFWVATSHAARAQAEALALHQALTPPTLTVRGLL